MFPRARPIGKHYRLGAPSKRDDIEVIGVVKDVKYDGLDEDAEHAGLHSVIRKDAVAERVRGPVFGRFGVMVAGFSKRSTAWIAAAVTE